MSGLSRFQSVGFEEAMRLVMGEGWVAMKRRCWPKGVFVENATVLEHGTHGKVVRELMKIDYSDGASRQRPYVAPVEDQEAEDWADARYC